MWQQHRRQEEEKGRPQQLSFVVSATSHRTPASLERAREEAQARKLAAREAEVEASRRASSVSDISSSDSVDSESDHDRKRRRMDGKEHRREKKSRYMRDKKSKKKRKREKQERKRSHKDSKHKKKHRTDEGGKASNRDKRAHRSASPSPPSHLGDATTVDKAEPLPLVTGATFADEDESTHEDAKPLASGTRRVLGAQRPEEAADEAEKAQRIRQVWDDSLGVYSELPRNLPPA